MISINSTACYKLLSAVIYSAVYHSETSYIRRINREFVKTPIIDMWCEVSGYDEKRIKNKILEINKKI